MRSQTAGQLNKNNRDNGDPRIAGLPEARDSSPGARRVLKSRLNLGLNVHPMMRGEDSTVAA